MKLFRVPQRNVQVRVLLEGGEELEGSLYAPTAGPGGGPGRLSERLNDETEYFVPLAGPDEACLISKSFIVAVWLPQGEEELEFQESDQAKECYVELCLKGGIEIVGHMKYTMPVEKRRILDYLNAAPRFVPVLEEGRVILVNKQLLVRVRDSAGAD
jgi:hypothetical protein